MSFEIYFFRSFFLSFFPRYFALLTPPCTPFRKQKNSGAVFGGYFSDCWQSSDDYRTSSKPFLFAFSDDDKKAPLEGREVFICEKVGGPEAALFDYGAL